MAAVYKNFQLGAGLTFQQGPFKFKRNERAPVQTVTWKGGGVPGGGQAHAGNGNFNQTMNPSSLLVPNIAPGVAQDNPSSYSRIFNGAGFKRAKAQPPNRFQTIGEPIGFPEGAGGVQTPSMGGGDSMHRGVNKASEMGILQDAREDFRQPAPAITTAAQQAFNSQSAIRYPAESTTGALPEIDEFFDANEPSAGEEGSQVYGPGGGVVRSAKRDRERQRGNPEKPDILSIRHKRMEHQHHLALSKRNANSVVVNIGPNGIPNFNRNPTPGPQPDPTVFNIATELESHHRASARIQDILEPVGEHMDMVTRREIEDAHVSDERELMKVDSAEELQVVVRDRIEHLQDLQSSPYLDGPTVTEISSELNHAKDQMVRIAAEIAGPSSYGMAAEGTSFINTMVKYQPGQEKRDDAELNNPMVVFKGTAEQGQGIYSRKRSRDVEFSGGSHSFGALSKHRVQPLFRKKRQEANAEAELPAPKARKTQAYGEKRKPKELAPVKAKRSRVGETREENIDFLKKRTASREKTALNNTIREKTSKVYRKHALNSLIKKKTVKLSKK